MMWRSNGSSAIRIAIAIESPSHSFAQSLSAAMNVLADDRRQVALVRVGNRVGPRDDGGGERRRACARLRDRERAHGLGDHLLRRLRVLRQVLDDHLHGHRVVIGMPAVVVGHQRHRRVADLGFARELGLLQVGHADDVRAPAA